MKFSSRSICGLCFVLVFFGFGCKKESISADSPVSEKPFTGSQTPIGYAWDSVPEKNSSISEKDGVHILEVERKGLQGFSITFQFTQPIVLTDAPAIITFKKQGSTKVFKTVEHAFSQSDVGHSMTKFVFEDVKDFVPGMYAATVQIKGSTEEKVNEALIHIK